MEDKKILTTVWPVAALLLFAGLIIVLAPPSNTGMYGATYQPLGNGVQNAPDPNTQYVSIDTGLCYLFVSRPGTFFSKVSSLCREANPGRAQKEAFCRRRAEIDASMKCITGPWGPGGYSEGGVLEPSVTGMVPVDPLGCARLAEQYDIVIMQTLGRAQPPKQNTAMINPCTGQAEVAERSSYSPNAPMRDYSRVNFISGAILGSVNSIEGQQGDVNYVLCADGTARVTVASVSVCNTLG